MDAPLLKLRANFYRQFDADYSLPVPAEGYGGWFSEEIEIESHRVAVVLMHAWDCGTLESNPGGWRCCDEIPRTYRVCREVLPPLLAAIRASKLPLIHVVSGAGYFEQYPGYQKAAQLAGADDPAVPQVDKEGLYWRTKNFVTDRTFPGKQNKIDLASAPKLTFPKEAVPTGDEGVAKNSQQLFALCKHLGVNHLIYMGFNIDWCLLMSPGGMNDMWRHGVICSAVRQAVTAVENKETARQELAKEIGLWRVSVQGGLVLDDKDFIAGLRTISQAPAVSAAPVGTVVESNETWIESAGEVYGAKPDARGPIGGGAGYVDVCEKGDFTVNDLASLLDAAARAKEGQTIFVDPAAEIDFTEEAFLKKGACLTLQSGVTLASARGRFGSQGALLYSDAHQTTLIRALGPDVRITGLRLRGPDGKRRLAFHHRVFEEVPAPAIGRSEAYYLLPNSDGIVCEFDRLRVDNCEVSHWSHGGVYLVRGKGHRVQHSFIHHIQRMGLGYGVCHNFDSESLIEYCLFQDGKHHIAGTGSPGQCYEAAHNIVLPYTESHVFNGKVYGQDHLFDVHGGEDRRDGTNIAGKNFLIHHNTFMSEYLAVCIRGEPGETVDVYHNWFYAPQPSIRADITDQSKLYQSPAPSECVVMAVSSKKTRVFKNAYGRRPAARLGLD